jgi:spermidine synthase
MDKKQSKLVRDCVVVTAFLEGVSVLVVEIAGARALAPFYGTTLTVWTSQITATLLFLALGYGVGGLLTRRPRDTSLVRVFCIAGLWLGLFPVLRGPILDTTGPSLGVAVGSFVSSCLLFGPPLLCLGAVSPLLIERLDRIRSGAGTAAGTLFFVNTLGGLVGGWLTALWLIPNVPLRLALAGVGVVLILIGTFWVLFLRASRPWMPAATLLLCVLPAALTWKSPDEIQVGENTARVLYRSQSNVGLVQVLEYDSPPSRVLLLDGVTQGGMTIEDGLSSFSSTVFQSALAYRFHPEAKSALLLGIGAGLVAKQLVERNVQVTAIEVEQKVVNVAREYFGFPESAQVVVEDGRTYLNRSEEKFDLVFLDAFAGENIPWYLTTLEAVQRIRHVLNPGGRLVINTITLASGQSEGLQRLESVLLAVFSEGQVFLNQVNQASRELSLTGVTIVAGNDLVAHEGEVPNRIPERIRAQLPIVFKSNRKAVGGVRPGTDDWHDLDYADMDVRSVWRRNVLAHYRARALED